MVDCVCMSLEWIEWIDREKIWTMNSLTFGEVIRGHIILETYRPSRNDSSITLVPIYHKFLVWDDLRWAVTGQNSQFSYYLYIKSYFVYFISNPLNFHTIVTKNGYSKISYLLFLYDDLKWPRQGQTRSRPVRFYIRLRSWLSYLQLIKVSSKNYHNEIFP